MKKRIFITCSAALSLAVLASGVYATQNIGKISEEPIASEKIQIQDAVRNSDVLKSRYLIVSQEDEMNDEMNGENDVQVQAAESAQMNMNDIDADNAIKLYNVLLKGSGESLSEQLNKDNEMWLMPQEVGDKMYFAFMKKGDDLDTAKGKINALNISDELKEQMIARAAERAGQWYVYRADLQSEKDKAVEFTAQNSISDLLAANNITNVSGIKYINITDNRSLGIWVQTADGEYIIPYTSTNSETVRANNAYTVSEFANLIAE